MKILIVGGGVAGLCLAHQLEKRDAHIKIITRKENFSSRIAAGMINPVVFRKLLHSWEADTFIPYLNAFYTDVEEKIGAQFFNKMPIRRTFATEEEAELWKERVQEDKNRNYLEIVEDDIPAYAKNPFGCGIVHEGGYIASAKFVAANQQYFEQKNMLEYADFEYDKLDENNKTYQNSAYDFIFFAEGYQGVKNPYFGYLPLNQTKGEILEIESDELRTDEILNRKCFVLPVGDRKFRLGATFEWNTEDVSPTEEKKEELLEKYAAICTADMKVNSQLAGIRPTTGDRRPLLGKHPVHPSLVIFNGLGTKGYMLAPYLSQQLVAHVLEDGAIHPEAKIERWHKKHYHKYTLD